MEHSGVGVSGVIHSYSPAGLGSAATEVSAQREEGRET